MNKYQTSFIIYKLEESMKKPNEFKITMNYKKPYIDCFINFLELKFS